MGRAPCCDEVGIKKGPWTPEEDQKLVDYIQRYGKASWRSLPKCAGLNRCGKSCRLRWSNYLRPDIKRGSFTEEEDGVIIKLHSHLGNKWSAIATHLPGRTDNEIKNYWNTHLKKKLLQMGIDPVTHKPRTDPNLLGSVSQFLAASNFCNLMNPWDAANMARIQMLQTLLSAMTSNIVPPATNLNMGSSSFSTDYQLNEFLRSNCQFDGLLLNGSLGHVTHDPTPTHSTFSDLGIQQVLPSSYKHLEESFVSFGGQQISRAAIMINGLGSNTPDCDNNYTGSGNSYNQMAMANCAIAPAIPTAPPSLVSSPSSEPANAVETFHDHSSTSTTFDAWGELNLDDQSWADIIEQTLMPSWSSES